MLKFSLLLMLTTFVSGCQLTPSESDQSGWFLRSEFTWWEARPEYQLKMTEDESTLELRFDLQPDGQAYNIKLADKLWSAGRNCGSDIAKGKPLKLNQWFDLHCTTEVDPITPLKYSYQFKPKRAGEYLITVKLKQGKPSSIKLSLN